MGLVSGGCELRKNTVSTTDIRHVGSIDWGGHNVTDIGYCVRPAMLVELDK